MNIDQWIDLGYRNGWCTAPLCITHDGLPTSAEEDQQLDSDDICITIIRLCDNHQHQTAINNNHSASQWRAHNLGFDK